MTHISEYLPEHAELLMKLAKGKYEEDLPWVTAAGSGAVGHELAKKLVKGKGKVPAAVAATILGTAVGVKGGRSLGEVLDKTAAKEKRKKKSLLGVAARGAAKTAPLAIPSQAISEYMRARLGAGRKAPWRSAGKELLQGGALLGTAGGSYAVGKELWERHKAKKSEKEKGAAAKKKKKEPTEPGSTGKILRTVGTGLAGMATGTLAGYGAGRLAESVAGRMGKKIPMKYVVPAATAAGAGLNLAHSMWKAHEMEALRRAVEGK